MSKRRYEKKTAYPVVNTTRNGGRFVRPFDILRSESGIAVIREHAHKSVVSKERPIRKAASSEKSNNSE